MPVLEHIEASSRVSLAVLFYALSLKCLFPSSLSPTRNKPLKSFDFRGSILLSGYQDSNLGPPAPKAGALTGLRYTPIQVLSGIAMQRYTFFPYHASFTPKFPIKNSSRVTLYSPNRFIPVIDCSLGALQIVTT